MFVLLMLFFLCLRGVVVVVGLLYLRLYSSTLHRTGETIWHFAAFVSRLLLFLLNTFTTSDTTSMSATLTFNRISVKSVKRKREAVGGCECFEWRLFICGLLLNNPWKVVWNEFSFMQILVLTRCNMSSSKNLECYTFCQSDNCHFDRYVFATVYENCLDKVIHFLSACVHSK